MPRQKSYETAPPGKNPNIIHIEQPKARLPMALHEAATRRKAGVMGGKTPRPSPFGYDREAVGAETREILDGSDEMTVEEKQERLLQIVEEFNSWSQGEYTSELANVRSIREKAMMLKRLIGQELVNSANDQGAGALDDWICEISKMGF